MARTIRGGRLACQRSLASILTASELGNIAGTIQTERCPSHTITCPQMSMDCSRKAGGRHRQVRVGRWACFAGRRVADLNDRRQINQGKFKSALSLSQRVGGRKKKAAPLAGRRRFSKHSRRAYSLHGVLGSTAVPSICTPRRLAGARPSAFRMVGATCVVATGTVTVRRSNDGLDSSSMTLVSSCANPPSALPASLCSWSK